MGTQARTQGQSTAQAVKARLSLLDIAKTYMQLRHSGGGRWVAPCPFHNETKPSFSINESEGFFYCFGCQASGDLIDFYCRINGLDFKEGLAQLADMAGVEIKVHSGRTAKDDEAVRLRRAMLKMHDAAAAYFSRNLQSQAAAPCREYIATRKISPDMAERFALGWSLPQWQGLADELARAGFKPEDAVQAGLLSVSAEKGGRPYDRFRGRLMFPIKTLAGQTVAFGGRIIAPDENAAKYINSPESSIYHKSEHLYGLYQARRAISQAKTVLLTEGYLDVITLHQYSFEYACGVLGTALTPEQVGRLSNLCSKVELIFDGDAPGRKAALRSAEMILTRGLNCRVVLLPEGEDIDSLLKSHGPELFEDLRRKAPEGLDFCIDALRRDFAPREMVDWVKDFLGRVSVPELISRFASELCNGLDLDETQIRGQVKKNAKSGAGRTTQSSAAPRGTAGGRMKETAASPAGQGLSPEEVRGRGLIHFLACFPGYTNTLHGLGGEILINTPFVRGIWEKLLAFGPEEALEHFSPEEKTFWIRCKALEPLAQADEQEFFKDICAGIEREIAKQRRHKYKTVLRHSAGEDDQREVMQTIKAVNEHLGNL